MPEGHTLHRLARRHQKRFGRKPVIVSSPQGRFEDGAAAVSGRVLRRADAWGKHLFHHYDGGEVVHVHLGLYGTFTEAELPLDEPVGQVRMRMIGAVDDIVARLGPDPLRADADPGLAWTRIAKSRRTIGALLMDQTVIAGVGNVYRSELLHRHHIDPFRPGTDIDADEFAAMWTDLVALMKVGVRRGKIVAIRPEDDHGAPAYGPGRPRTYVYRRAGDPCRACGTTVRTAQLEARSVFWCPSCQT